MDQSNVNFNYTSTFLDVKNHLFRATFMALSYISGRMAKFVLKFPNFHYNGNRGCPMYISTTPVNCLTWKTPCLVHYWCIILLY